MRSRLRGSVWPATAAIVGLAVGAAVTVVLQGAATPSAHGPDGVALVGTGTKPPETFLVWVPRGLPAGFDDAVGSLRRIGRVTTVAQDNAWLARSWDVDGEPVDRSRGGYRIPLDTIAVDPVTFAAFLPAADRPVIEALVAGDGVLGATSAVVRGLGPGSVLGFPGGERVRIAAVLPDEAVGAAELMVSRETGRRIGVRTDRSLLLQPAAGRALRTDALRVALDDLLPSGLGPYGRVQVRGQGETPYFRPGDAVLPTVMLKTLFGEFAARPEPGRPGYLDLDPAWTQAQMETARLPVLGLVTCHASVMPQLRGAVRELVRRGLGKLVETYDGCFAPRFIGRDPTAMLSHHSWGIAIDMNIAGNYYGVPPDQDPRLVAVMERWGFAWGGRFIVPDGNHFEYHRAPAP
ncbi:MAG TPA: M15 family metallopeptidase [Actinomycetota bacterium]|nr:M15 family metallopeptidase [Actinomycetota bacterium]